MVRTFVEKLATARRNKKCGNHNVVWVGKKYWDMYSEEVPSCETMKITRLFQYHGHTIVAVNDETEEFWMSHCGWYTVSTKNALAGYRDWFKAMGYTWVNPFSIYKYEDKA